MASDRGSASKRGKIWSGHVPWPTSPGPVDQELLLRNEYLVAENRILKAQLKERLRLSDAERAKLGEIGHRLGRKALGEVATTALPDTILAWYRRLVARKFDGSRARRTPGRPRIDREVEELIVRLLDSNPRLQTGKRLQPFFCSQAVSLKSAPRKRKRRF